jgi:hypothetical protein
MALFATSRMVLDAGGSGASGDRRAAVCQP